MSSYGDCYGCDEDSDIRYDRDNLGIAESRLDFELDPVDEPVHESFEPVEPVELDHGHEHDVGLPPPPDSFRQRREYNVDF